MPPQMIPFAEEMKLIGVAVNPAVRGGIFNRFEFVSFFLIFLLTCCNVSKWNDNENEDEASDVRLFKKKKFHQSN